MLLVAYLLVMSLTTGHASTAAAGENSLTFDPAHFTTKTLTLGNQTFSYRACEGIVYVSNPVDVWEGRYEASEMAIATFLMARAAGKDLVLLPDVLAARFQEGALLCRAGGRIHGPADLVGRQIGVRAYSQTTGMWLRGALQDGFGLRPEAMRWVTFEDAHLAAYRDPPWAERAAPGADMLAMLRAGELDAAIFGDDLPADPALRPVFADPVAAGADFRATHGLVPVNHLLVARGDVARERPEALAELLRLLRASGAEVSRREGLGPALTLAIRYAHEQGLLPRPLSLDEVWEGSPPDPA